MFPCQKGGQLPTHPGEDLADELNERGLSAAEFGRRLALPHKRMSAIPKVRRSITAEIEWAVRPRAA